VAPTQVLKKVEACVAATGDPSLQYDCLKMLLGNQPMYIFRVDGPRRCPYGHQHDGSNNFNVQVDGRDLLKHCNGSVCQDICPLLKSGELSFAESLMGGETHAVHESDPSVYGNLTKWFVDYWAFQGDAGGCKIAAQMYARCGRYVLIFAASLLLFPNLVKLLAYSRPTFARKRSTTSRGPFRQSHLHASGYDRGLCEGQNDFRLRKKVCARPWTLGQVPYVNRNSLLFPLVWSGVIKCRVREV
jgi:hypothetical protein